MFNMERAEKRHFPYNAKIPSEDEVKERAKHVVLPSTAEIGKHVSSLRRKFPSKPVLGKENAIEIGGVSISPDELGRYIPSIDEKQKIGMSFTVQKKGEVTR